jgi:hypothetical protein
MSMTGQFVNVALEDSYYGLFKALYQEKSRSE